MRALKITLAALPLAALLSGCGSEEPSKAGGEPTKTASSTPAATTKTIPDGDYQKSVTVADAKAAGITNEDFLQGNFAAGGATTLTFRFADGRWTLFVALSGGAPEPGDLGSLTYDEEGNAVMTSESEGCPGCVTAYKWQVDGSRLTLTLVEHNASDAPEDLAAVRFITEGVFTRPT